MTSLEVRVLLINNFENRSERILTTKVQVIKYIFAIIIVGVVLLNSGNVISDGTFFFTLSIIFFITSYLMIAKKYYLFSSVLSKNSINPENIGRVSGIVAVIFGGLFLILAFVEFF